MGIAIKQEGGRDCLFVHVPKFRNYYKPLNSYVYVKYIPAGIIGIADLLAKNNFNIEIVHIGVEVIKDKRWDLARYVQENKIKVVAFSLYWHYQSYDTIEAARMVKAVCPDVLIVLGGFTGSFFSREILKVYSFIDAVIEGDGEFPMLSLLKEIKTGKPCFKRVPNLVWRDGQEIVRNDISYIASEADIDNICYTNFALLKNHDLYLEVLGRSTSFIIKKLSKKLQPKKFKKAMIPISVGRGCAQLCGWCGGNFLSQLAISGRRGVLYRSTNAVIKDIRKALDFGVGTIYLEPIQVPGFEDYFIRLFREIREASLKISVWYEQSGMLSKAFIEDFAQTFVLSGSTICISREICNENVRHYNRDSSYSNKTLLETLGELEKYGISNELALMFALPGEKEENVGKIKVFREMLLRKYKCLRAVHVRTKELEPASLWYLHPQKYNIETNRTCFTDYYNHHGNITSNSYSNLGYRIPGYFEDENRGKDFQSFESEIQKIKCNNFCVLGLHTGRSFDNWFGKFKCNLLYFFWQTLQLIERGRLKAKA